jgi:hypothetical protein
MFRRKLVVLVNNHKENDKKITFPQTKEENKKKKTYSKKILFSLFAIGLGAGIYHYQDKIFELTKDKINISIPNVLEDNNVLSNDIPVFISDTEKNQSTAIEKMPEVNLEKNKEKANELKEIMQEKRIETTNNEDTGALNTSPSLESENKYPEVNIQAIADKKEETLNKIDYTQENSKEVLQKELALVLKNSSFTANTKKENISLFINNINHNINERILNNNKFKLSDISLVCEDNQLPKFKFAISSNDNIVLYEKELSYSDNKKILLSFDSLSITDLDSNVENIFLPDEQIFKDFKLNSIEDTNGDLKFEFECINKKIVIVGKELSEIK